MKDERERVIFRREYDPYNKVWGYIAGFPDSPVTPGRIETLGFKLEQQYGQTVFEPISEADICYFLNRKIVHKNTDEANKCLEALEKYFGTEFRVCEKR